MCQLMLCVYLEELNTSQADKTLAVAQILVWLSGKHLTWHHWKKRLKKGLIG